MERGNNFTWRCFRTRGCENTKVGAMTGVTNTVMIVGKSVRSSVSQLVAGNVRVSPVMDTFFFNSSVGNFPIQRIFQRSNDRENKLGFIKKN